MEDDSGEKHIRLVYFLANGCTKLARALVERHVELEVSKSPAHSQGVWSLDDFLYDNMQKLSHVRGEQRHKLFPGRYKDTNIDEWDLNLLCLVISSCTENNELKQDWNQLKSIRNEVYHAGNTNIKTTQFQHFVEVIEVIVERCCKFIGKEEFTQDMKGMLENFKNGQITRNDKDMQKFQQWYESDPMAVVLQKVDGLSQENQLLMTKMDELLKLVKSVGLKGVVLPDTNVELIVKNCDKAKEKVISDHLVNLLKMKIAVDIPAVDKERILQAAKDAMSELLAGGRELTDVYQACVNLKIKCPSYKNMRALWEDCMTGRLTGVFKTLEKYIRLLSDCPDVELEVGITQFELYRCMEAIVTEIAKTLRAGNEDIFTGQTDTFKEITVTPLDIENTRKSARHSTESLGNSSKETEGTHIRLQIQPTTFCQAENLWEAFQSGSFNKKLESLAETFRKVFDMDELKITGKMEEASPYEELFRKKKRLFGADERLDKFEDLDEEVESFDGESWTEATNMQKEPHQTPSADSTVSGRVKSLCDAHQLIVMRNTHSASHEITNDETKDFFTLMLKCLEMPSSVRKFSCGKELKTLRELQNRELTGELSYKAYSAIIQELMNSISDQIASGDDPSNLIERLKAAVAMQEQYNIEADNEKEIEKLKKEIVERKKREIALAILVKEKDDIIETKNTKIKQLETKTKSLQEMKDREEKELTEKINELELRITDLSKDLDSKTHELKELRRKAENLSKENQDIKEQLILKDDSIKRLEEENQKIKLLLEVQKAEEKKLREYVKEIESRNETLNEAIHFLTDENKMLEKIKIELEQSLKKLAQRVMKLSAERNELERTTDDLKSKHKEINVLHDEINQLKISNDERNNEIRHISDILIIGSIVIVMVTVFLLRIGMILY